MSKSGVFCLKTKEEREMDERVQQRKRELIESFRLQKEEKREALASGYPSNVDTLRSVEEVESHRDSWERRREMEVDRINGGVSEALHSSLAASTPGGWQSGRNDDQRERRSYRLNAGQRLINRIVSYSHHINLHLFRACPACCACFPSPDSKDQNPCRASAKLADEPTPKTGRIAAPEDRKWAPLFYSISCIGLITTYVLSAY